MRNIIASLLLLVAPLAFADNGSGIGGDSGGITPSAIQSIREADSSPEVFPWQVIVPNGSLTDNADGTASLAAMVSGPASSTDNALVRWDGTGGTTIQNSAVTVADTTGDMVFPDNAILGLSTTTGRIEFDDQDTDEVNILSANVGIGDTGPDSLLDILSATTGTDLIITNTNATDTDVTVGLALAEGTNTFTLGVDDSDSDKFKISTTALGTSDRLIIDSAGLVGINDATPEALLDITAPAAEEALILRAPGSGTQDVLQVINTAGTTLATIRADGLEDSIGGFRATGQAGISGKVGVSLSYDGVSANINMLNAAGSHAKTLRLQNGFEVVSEAGSASPLSYFQFHTQGANATKFFLGNGTAPNSVWVGATGALAVGFTGYTGQQLNIFGPAVTQGDNASEVLIFDTTAMAKGTGGGLTFGGYYTSTPTDPNDGAFVAAGIHAYKEDATSGNLNFALTFVTRLNAGSITEKMRIDSAGNVGIGTTSPMYKLSIVGGEASLNNNQGFNFMKVDGSGPAGIVYADTSNNLVLNSGAARVKVTGITELSRTLQIQNYNGGVYFDKSDGTESFWQIFSDNGTGAYAGDSGLAIFGGTTPSTKLAITTAGNVGIGTTAPTHTLTVVGDMNSVFYEGEIVSWEDEQVFA